MIERRGLLLGAGVLLVGSGLGLSACNQSGGSAGGGTSGGSASQPDDLAIGPANASVTLIEYASLACPHCQEFERDVWPRLKQNYIDTGKIRFIMREFPTAAPPDIVLAEFQVARCNATPEQYYTRVSALFAQRDTIFSSDATRESIRDKLVQFGAAAGLSQDQIIACIGDEAGAARFQRVTDNATKQFNISGTPTFILNGTKVEDPTAVTYEGMSKILDAAIAAAHH
ncbi:MAG: thioredoxin domain-containing protein [Pseudomonadota bacterium]